ncbi:Uncharacterized protein Rs2_26638 [Raphanus sativus]|nr:Uncharacterized protein Rs2_26638 [Raphanus sativus]
MENSFLLLSMLSLNTRVTEFSPLALLASSSPKRVSIQASCIWRREEVHVKIRYTRNPNSKDLSGGMVLYPCRWFLGFGAAGYSVVRSLLEAPKYASVIADILKHDTTSFTKHIKKDDLLSDNGELVSTQHALSLSLNTIVTEFSPLGIFPQGLTHRRVMRSNFAGAIGDRTKKRICNQTMDSKMAESMSDHGTLKWERHNESPFSQVQHRCAESGVSYLCLKFESITEAPDGLRLVACQKQNTPLFRLPLLLLEQLLQYEVGGPKSLYSSKLHMA